MKLKYSSLVLAAVVAWAGTGFGADTTPAYQVVPHADTQYAHELLRLKQVEVIKGQLADAKGSSLENMWKSELVLAQYDELVKTEGAGKVDDEYLSALTAYFDGQNKGGGIDGAWALDHGQFILSKLAQPILTRMEYFGSSGRDREALAPLAALAERLLQVGGKSLETVMKQQEATKPFDEKAYMRSYAAASEVRYYGAWAMYFKAMAMDPAKGGEDRKKLLSDAADALGEWAVDDADNGVNYQAYLLRGKARLELGDAAKAIADFAKAENEKAPDWVQYQAHYQTVVAQLRGGAGANADFRAAQTALEAFKLWVPQNNEQAQLSTDMLGYRVAWTIAESRPAGAERDGAKRDALQLLSAIIERDPRFRTLVYEQLASQIPEDADVKALMPMQRLALAFGNSQNQKGDTPESRKRLETALTAALAVKNDERVSRADKLESTFLAGACAEQLGKADEAAQYEVEFVEFAPRDARAKDVLEQALSQIGELRKKGTLTDQERDVAMRGLKLATETFAERQWFYAQARMLEEAGKTMEASAIYNRIGADDRNYLDARYRLVSLATDRFEKLSAQSGVAAEADQKEAAQELFATCSKFVDLLDHPPASAPKEVLEAAAGYRYNIWLIEAATALHPAVKQTDIAIDRLTKLDQARAHLTDAQRATVLRYQVEAYQAAGQPDKAMEVVNAYAAAQAGAGGQGSGGAMNVIRGMVLSMVDEIDKVEPTDAPRAKVLSGNVVRLLDLVIAQAKKDGKSDVAYDYRVIQADMMVRAGQYPQAQELAVTLEKEKESDLHPYMTEARAIFAQAEATGDKAGFAKAQDYFTRILARLSPGSESYWESWLRIVQSMEGQGAENASADIKKHLADLKGVYGSKFGGDRFKEDFRRLAIKFDVE